MKFDVATIGREVGDALIDMKATKPSRAVLTADLVNQLRRNGLTFDSEGRVSNEEDLGLWLIRRRTSGEEPFIFWAKFLGGCDPPWKGWEWHRPTGQLRPGLRALVAAIRVLRHLGLKLPYPMEPI